MPNQESTACGQHRQRSQPEKERDFVSSAFGELIFDASAHNEVRSSGMMAKGGGKAISD
jgi:hypothetical protein